MTEGPNGPVIDTLSDVRYELMVLNEQVRSLLLAASRDPVAPVVEVLPAPIVLPEPMQPQQLIGPAPDFAPLIGALQGISNSDVVNALGEMRKDITDLAGVLRAIGLGDSSYGGGGGPSHVTAEVYSKAGLTVKTEDAEKDSRFEWQDVGSERKPLYIGTAAPGTGSAVESWVIQKYTYSGVDLALVQTRTGAWDDRATLF